MALAQSQNTGSSSGANQNGAKLKTQVEKYVDPLTGLTAKQLRVGYWLETHKGGFARAGMITLLALDAILVAYSLFAWGRHVIFGISGDRAIVSELARPGVEVNTLRDVRRPTELQVISNNVFSVGNDKYDFVVEVVNPNPEWFVAFDYRFTFRGGETEWRRSFLLPGENTVRGELGFEFQVRPREAILELDNIKWNRISAHLTADPMAYVKSRTDFLISDAEFISGGEDANRVHFALKNNTPYSYWSVPLVVVMLRGGAVSGVETVTVEPFESGEEKTVDVVTGVAGSQVSEIRILPILNIFDKNAYRTPEG